MPPDVPAGAAPTAVNWLSGGGEMGKLIRSMDWARTPLGPIESWPQSLRTTVSLCLASNFPISIAWGPHRVQVYNDGYWPICGGKHPRSMGQDFKECWFSAWPAIGEAFERASAGETSFIENRRMFLDRNGYLEETFFTFSFSPIRDETGGVGGLFHPVTELTQQTLAERRLKVVRDLADSTADAQSVAQACTLIARTLAACDLDLPFVLLYLLDADGTQARLAASAGLAPGTAASPEIVALQASQLLAWPLAEVARSGQSAQVDEVHRQFGPLACGPYPESPQTALVLPISLAGRALPFGLLVAGVSARRALDEAYRTFYEMLKDTVRNALTNAWAYEEERKRAEALAELDRAKTAFFSNVSHEFRTPLTLMLGPLEQTLTGGNGALTPPQRAELEVVHRNGLRLLKLVNTLLDFSRIEAGRIQAVYEPTDLAAYTTDLASVFRSAIERAGLRLVIECPPLPEPVYVDREMWEKIVLNLLSNAFKFTFAGEIAVRLDWCGDHIALAVRDTGTGIPKHELPLIFERFHRIRNARARTHEGTGIGLSLVQELTRLHGGQITAESAVEVGTTFTVTVPTGTAHLPTDRVGATRSLASTALGADAYAQEALRWLPDPAPSALIPPDSDAMLDELGSPAASAVFPLPTEASASGRRARILWADDNADMRDYVRRLLSVRYDVETVADGKAALAEARICRPDLVLADVMMPQLDGFGVLRALRADPETRTLPVILLSARAGEEARIEGLEAGADAYLVKPFSARELLAHVESHIKLGRLRARQQLERQRVEEALREQTEVVETINRVGQTLSAELDLPTLVQAVADAATTLTGAQFGAFFYNVSEARGESYILYTLAGASREQFTQFPLPRNTALFGPTFRGTGIVRLADVTQDPRYGQNAPYYGLPPGHLPVTSYLAVPVVSRSGEGLGGLFFGHPEVGVFTDRHERLIVGLAAQAAVAIDNARLFAAAQQEINERQQLEAVLRESEQRYRHLFDTAGVSLWAEDFSAVNSLMAQLQAQGVTDFQRFFATHPEVVEQAIGLVQVVDVNAATVRMFEARDKHELLGSLHRIFVPETREVFLGELLAIAAGHTFYEAETVVQTLQGKRLHVLFTITFPPPDARHRSVLVSLTDITARKQAEVVLQQAHAALEQRVQERTALLALIQDVTQAANEAPTSASALQYAVDRLCTYTGWPVGHAYLAVAPGADRWAPTAIWHLDAPERFTAFQQATQALEVGAGEGLVGRVGACGKPEWYVDVATDSTFRRRYAAVAVGLKTGVALPILAGSEVVGVLEFYATEPLAPQPALLEALTLMGTQLGRAVERERAAAQVQQQQEALLQREKLAAMSTLLASVAHELNNPLATILLQAELVGEDVQGGPLAEPAAEIAQAAARCERLVRQFLTLARQHPSERAALALNTLVAETVEILAYPFRVDNVRVHLYLDEQLPLLWGDPHQLQQVLLNLLTNAQHALRAAPGAREITCTTQYDPTQHRITLAVADTGPGIPLALQGRIFEPFFTTKPPGVGTGLGLPLCQGIVEAHGGTLEVTSVLGHGATFRITLPVEAVPVSPPTLPSAPEGRAGRGYTILVVEDERSLARGLLRLLQRDGHTVNTVANGRLALAKLDERDYDLILCDVRMPELDGPSLYRLLERQQPHLCQRFIFLTGDTLEPATQAFLAQSGVPCLTKPFSIAEARRAIQRTMHPGRAMG